MYLCYLDESGTPEIGSQTSHFVLVGLAIPATLWLEKDRRIDSIKSEYGLKGVEIHTGYIARRFPEQEKVQGFDQLDQPTRKAAVLREREMELIRTAALKKPERLKELKKTYRKTGDYLHLGQDERRQLLRRLADEVGAWQEVHLFGNAICKRTLPSPAAADEIYSRAFHQVATVYQDFLRATKRTPDDRNFGMLIADNNPTVAMRITVEVRQLHERGALLSSPRSLETIIETPLFVDSSLTSMVQMADLCAYAARRFFENGELDLFDRIFPRFGLKSTGPPHLFHFTGSEACPCKVCQIVNAPLR